MFELIQCIKDYNWMTISVYCVLRRIEGSVLPYYPRSEWLEDREWWEQEVWRYQPGAEPTLSSLTYLQRASPSPRSLQVSPSSSSSSSSLRQELMDAGGQRWIGWNSLGKLISSLVRQIIQYKRIFWIFQ